MSNCAKLVVGHEAAVTDPGSCRNGCEPVLHFRSPVQGKSGLDGRTLSGGVASQVPSGKLTRLYSPYAAIAAKIGLATKS